MKKIRINRQRLEIYDSIDELPINRFHLFNKYVLIDAGIGTDLNDVVGHIMKINSYLDSDVKLARKELNNMKDSLYLIMNGVNLKHLSFIPLIRSINGKLLTDMSDENIKRISEELNLSKGWVSNVLDAVKKKLDKELRVFFPDKFDSAQEKEIMNRLKSRTLLELDGIIRENDNSERISLIDKWLLTINKPLTFSGAKGLEITYQKDYTEACLFLKKELNSDVDKMTVLAFYSAFEYIKKNLKSKSKSHGRRN